MNATRVKRSEWVKAMKALGTTSEKLSVRLGQTTWEAASEAERAAWLLYQTWVVQDNADEGGRLASMRGFPVAWCNRDSRLTGKNPPDWS